MINEKIKQSNWGDKILENMSKDLKEEFPDMKGLSVSNLKTCKLFLFLFFNWFTSCEPNSNINSNKKFTTCERNANR